MIKMIRSALAAAILTAALCLSAYAADGNDVMQDIEKMILLGENAGQELGESIVKDIRKNPSAVTFSLIAKFQNKDLTDTQKTVYIWALGLAKDEKAVPVIEEAYRHSKSELVRKNCLNSLAVIGGNQAGEFLMSKLNDAANAEERFDILDMLAQMQSEAALPKSEEILKLDIKQYYWRSIFFFGKMGDRAVPFLLKKIGDENQNVRANAVNVIGQWLTAPDASKPLADRFWKEKNAEIRGMILSSLERTMANLTEMRTFFGQVAKKEKNKELAKYAKETLANINKIKAAAKTFAEQKKIVPELFNAEYEKLFDSAGKKGSYDVLGFTSTVKDEPRFKKLRERILQRNSDEAFYDYQKVNAIIIKNRMIEANNYKK